jgi:hypothetical protein
MKKNLVPVPVPLLKVQATSLLRLMQGRECLKIIFFAQYSYLDLILNIHQAN